MTNLPPEVLIRKKNLVLDATVLSTLMGCARLTNFRFGMNLMSIGGKSNSLECGSIVHKVLEVFRRNQINGFSKSQAIGAGLAAGQMYIKGCQYCTDFQSTDDIPVPQCGHLPNEYPGVKNTPRESSNEKGFQRIGWEWVLKTCEQYFEFYQNDIWVPLEVEVVKGKIAYEDDEIRILWKAKLDLIVDTNQTILPVDYKTMKARRDIMSLNNQFIGQCFVMGTHNVILDKIGFQTTLKPEEKFQRVSVSYSTARIEEWKNEILPYWAYKFIDYQENDYWPPNFDHCENKYGNCAFISVCESEPNMRETELQQNFIVGPDWNPTNEDA